jgi:diguanylate cyclase (GGDEF)-like protein
MLEEQVALIDPKTVDKLQPQAMQFSLVFIDLDYFKSINDTYGHLVGSRLLAEVGGLLRRIVGPDNSAFRYGGDEFVVLLPGTTKEAATALTLELCQSLRDAIFLQSDGIALRLSGSFGLATFPEDGASVHAILRSADSMMYDVKNSTRDNVAVMGKGRVMSVGIPISPERKAAGRR